MNSTANDSKDRFKIQIPEGPPKETALDRAWRFFVIGLVVFLVLILGGLLFDLPAFDILKSNRSPMLAVLGLLGAGLFWWIAMAGRSFIVDRVDSKVGRNTSFTVIGIA